MFNKLFTVTTTIPRPFADQLHASVAGDRDVSATAVFTYSAGMFDRGYLDHLLSLPHTYGVTLDHLTAPRGLFVRRGTVRVTGDWFTVSRYLARWLVYADQGVR